MFFWTEYRGDKSVDTIARIRSEFLVRGKSTDTVAKRLTIVRSQKRIGYLETVD